MATSVIDALSTDRANIPSDVPSVWGMGRGGPLLHLVKKLLCCCPFLAGQVEDGRPMGKQ